MDTVTYSNKDVVNFINNYLIPLRIDVSDGTQDDDFHHFWTPTTAILNMNGDEIQRTVGFMQPQEFLVKMHLGLGKARLDQGKYDTAMIHLKNVLDAVPTSDDVPEAIFFSGVVLYKETSNPVKLKEAYKRLEREYPDDPWTKRAYPYRLI